MADSSSLTRNSLLYVTDGPVALGRPNLLSAAGFDVTTANSAGLARNFLVEKRFDVLVVEQELENRSTAELLARHAELSPHSIRVLIVSSKNLSANVELINNSSHVHRLLFHPYTDEQLLQTLDHACRQCRLERSHEEWDLELHKFIRELENNVKERTAELELANRQLQQRNLMLTRMALTDPLTGLPNRRAMDRLAKNELVRRSRYSSPMAIAFIDVDHFKDINSMHLLSGGDHALSWLAQTLSASVRTVDTVGRVGGDEFMLVAPETDPEGAWSLIERIRTTVAQGRTSFSGADISLSVSIGMAVAQSATPGGYEALRHTAASALSEAKTNGRNRSVLTLMGQENRRSEFEVGSELP